MFSSKNAKLFIQETNTDVPHTSKHSQTGTYKCETGLFLFTVFKPQYTLNIVGGRFKNKRCKQCLSNGKTQHKA